MKLNDILTRHGVIRIGGAAEKFDDMTSAPGPKTLIAGDMDAGFFGEVPVEELINGVNLAAEGRITSGTSVNSNAPWLKSAWEGRIVFVSKKPYRRDIPLNRISTNREIIIQGSKYKLTLVDGLSVYGNRPPAGEDYHYSQWNKLILPLHERSLGKNWGTPSRVEADVQSWGINYSDEDFGVAVPYSDWGMSWTLGYGLNTWTAKRQYAARALDNNISYGSISDDTFQKTWRPLLEYIEEV